MASSNRSVALAALVVVASGWPGALSYCQSLSLAGRTDWRLPTVKDLQTIVEEQVAGPSIDLVAFPGTPAEWFWTSTPTAQPHGFAWGVSFTDGYSTPNAVTSLFQVRCVVDQP